MPKLVVKTKTLEESRYLTRPVSEKTATSIRGKVASLKAREPKAVIVFRGQSKLTKTLQAKVRQELPVADAIAAFEKATKTEAKAARDYAAKVAKQKDPKVFDQRRVAFNAKLTGAELLALKHQEQLSGKYFVSTTRDLAIACGDFHLAGKMRYVYVLALPKKTGLNLYSLNRLKSDILRVLPPPNQREKEVAIPVEATSYVRAVYDLENERFVPLK